MSTEQMVILSHKIMLKYYMFGIDVGIPWERMEGLEVGYKFESVAERSYQTLNLLKETNGKLSIQKIIETMAWLELPYEETLKELKSHIHSKG